MTQILTHYLRSSLSIFFEYDTPRYVHIKSKRIGILSRLIEVSILSYIIGFVLVYNHGYQSIGEVDSTIVTKVKGYLFTNYSDSQLNLPFSNGSWYRRYWDAVDTVFPSDSGFFIMTNLIITPAQERGICPEDPLVPGAGCTDDSDCESGRSLDQGNGVQSGTCNKTTWTCDIYAWCPLEQNILPLNGSFALLQQTQNFTMLIKNSIRFPKFGPEYNRRNILESANSTYLQSCTYSRENDPFCPIFRVGDVVKGAGEDWESVAVKGGIFIVQIAWNCNLDFDFLTYCIPSYSFRRADNPSAQIAPGWNYRMANYYSDHITGQDQNHRTQFKMFGIKVLIEVIGEGRKFHLIPLLVNVGSGLALMGLATILCDIIVLYFLKTGGKYKDKKYLTVHGDDAFVVNNSSRRRDSINYSQESLVGEG